MQKFRGFLKWPGNKYRVLDHICPALPPGKKLIEPFVGSAAVFLNTDYESYLLTDINPDLINLYQILQSSGKEFIHYSKKYFTERNNVAEKYYRLRDQFNQETDPWKKAGLFVYLNRHGYNGLCRYNLKKMFNVPFGRYKRPYFPAAEMEFFHQKSQDRVTFKCLDFQETLKTARAGHVVYCDPPYVPLTTTAYFTSYSHKPFQLTEQQQLASLAQELSTRDIPVLISNHNTDYTREIYQNAKLTFFTVPRFISCKSREPAQELLALFTSPLARG